MKIIFFYGPSERTEKKFAGRNPMNGKSEEEKNELKQRILDAVLLGVFLCVIIAYGMVYAG